MELFESRGRLALPGAMKDEAGLAKNLPRGDLEAGLRAAYEKERLGAVDGFEEGSAPKAGRRRTL